ncbi:RNA-directed DNA polymerase, eukaryota, reverse transcriptase zinc-binding domain protein [Tanacetum coccineum]|uniref:RNA-directed DNA polymerase, eukaryota, reverse transcriptase zinc-binding domain protein n=1 Tax=Tanacetum coccineum TaxID=301880 RepID=A0ABQ5H4J5_9ASTR
MIRDLPLCAWGSNAYKKAADMFAKFMFFEAEESTKMSPSRICISTKSHNFVLKRVLVEVHGVNYDVHVHELGTWNINIVDETLDSSDNLDVNVSSDLSRPLGFEHMKRTSSKCSTSFARYRKKDIKGVSPIEELSRIIELGDSLDNSDLIDLPLGGRLFTWMNKAGTKLSKLDRFLISEEVVEALPDVRVTAIDRLWSDHNPILLHVSKFDFGPTPFKLFHSWLLHDSFDKVIKTELPKLEEHNFGRKQKAGYQPVRAAQPVLHFPRYTFESFDLFQNALSNGISKVTRTPKKIHGLIKQIRRAQIIHGIMKEGVWISNPSKNKEEFLNFFKEKFKDHDSNVDFPPFVNSSGLCALDCDSLETHVSLDEVKNAVWDYGSSKAPGPDGFSFAFVKKY